MRDQEILDLREAYSLVCETSATVGPVDNETSRPNLGAMTYSQRQKFLKDKADNIRKNRKEEVESLDESDLQQKVGKALDAASKNPVVQAIGKVIGPVGKGRRTPTATSGGYRPEEVETDLFDTILEYLVAEGYADTNENALVIMANMSEEWRQSIVEDTINERVKYSDNDYRGGGGDEKRLRTGMSTREVSQLGRQNINRAIGKEPLGTQIKQKLFGREVPVPPNAGFKPGGSRMMLGSSPGTTADPLPGPRARYHGPAR